MTQYRNIMFTLNNPTPDDIRVLEDILSYRPNGRQLISYIVFQEEIGESGTRHLQGYIEFTRRIRLRGIKQINTTFNKMHIENRRGTQQQAIDYCKKTGIGGRIDGTEIRELGERRRQGRHENGANDMTKVGQMVLDGKGIKEIEESYPSAVIRYGNGIMNMIERRREHRNWRPKVKIYYSEESGTGKSYLARTKYPDAYHATWPTGGRWWWPSYSGEEIIILDEFRHQISYDVMLRLLDYGAMWIEGKGTNHKLQAKKIIITTNHPPHRWYPKKTPDEAQMLQRRISEFAKIYRFLYPMRTLADGTPNPEVLREDLQPRQQAERQREEEDPYGPYW